jgi:hypothetical protein
MPDVERDFMDEWPLGVKFLEKELDVLISLVGQWGWI